MEDLYQILGVSRDASQADIKKAYRQLVRQYHPDTHQGDAAAEEKFKKINAAYSVIGDQEKRARYDQFGSEDGQNPFGGGFGGGFGDLFGDLFEQVFGGGMGGGGFGRRADPNAPRAGANLEMSLRVTLLEAANGTTRNLEIPHQDACETCGGSGAKPGTKPKVCDICGGRGQVESMARTPFGQFVTMTTCQRCGGTGKVIEERCETCGGHGVVRKNHKVEVKIPAGVETGTRLRVTGEGDHGQNGGPKGDLFLVLSVDHHEKFERDGGDLHTYLTLSYPQAVLGATVEIDTLTDGREKVGVPAGTEHGRVLKIKGKGMPRLRGARGRGDLHAHVLIDIPTKLTDKQKAIIESLAKELGEAVQPKEESFFDKVKKMF